MQVAFAEQRAQLSSRLLGVFNAHNLLGVIGTLLASGVALADAVRVTSELTPVAGRMQQLGGGEQPLVAVDYAHTPDALEKVLCALRPVVESSGRLICVFGCGGDHDRGGGR
jgi:UDP-N-acetylmuramoyl-L-alanyl-D-glutamate--2,6-diaminopimelate ligase